MMCFLSIKMSLLPQFESSTVDLQYSLTSALLLGTCVILCLHNQILDPKTPRYSVVCRLKFIYNAYEYLAVTGIRENSLENDGDSSSSLHLHGMPVDQPPKMIQFADALRKMPIDQLDQAAYVESSTPRLFSMHLRLVILSPSTYFGFLRISLN